MYIYKFVHFLLLRIRNVVKTSYLHLNIIHVNKLEKTDPSEIQRTYNIRKQQTRLY